MKKLLLLAVTLFSMTIGLGATASAATPDNFWKVDISKPAVSETKKNLNIAYNVFSVYAEDHTFDVKLYQNEVQVATQQIVHVNGDSGVFSISLPVSGTYSYQVSATITGSTYEGEGGMHSGMTKTSSPTNVQFVDGPNPTVVTINTNTASTTGGGTGTNGTGANGAGAGNTAGSGSTNGANSATGAANGTVTDKAANTADKAGSSLGSKTTKANSDTKWYVIGVAVLLLGGAAYYWFVYRKAGELE